MSSHVRDKASLNSSTISLRAAAYDGQAVPMTVKVESIGAGERAPAQPGTGVAISGTVDETLRILAVDNEPSVTLSLGYVFPRPHYELTCAESGPEALARLEADSAPFSVIIVDQKMPNLTGVELVGAIRERGIESKIIVLSAHLSAEVREAYAGMNVDVLFAKPFDVAQLRSAVDRLAA